MEIRRIGPDGAFIREFKDWQKRVQSIESKPAGKVTIRETLTTIDPETGVKTIFGELPDGSFGVQPFVYDITPPPIASTPIASAEPGLFVISWDGTFVGGADQPRDFVAVNVIGHKIVGGATVSSTPVGRTDTAYSKIYVSTDVVAVGETWEFSLEAEDYNGNRAEWSTRSALLEMKSLATDVAVETALADLQTSVQTAQETSDAAQLAADTAQGSADGAAQAALDAANLAEGKGKVLIQSTEPAVADQLPQNLWIDTTNGLNTPKRWSGSAWVTVTDKVATDAASAAVTAQNRADQAFNSATSAATAAGDAQTTADGKNKSWYTDMAPAGTGHKVGDLWFNASAGYRLSTWTGTAWQTTQDAALAQSTADSKGRTYTQNFAPPVDARLPQNLWIDTTAGVNLAVTKYWDGSAWTPVKDAEINAAEVRAALDAQAKADAAASAAINAQAYSMNASFDDWTGTLPAFHTLYGAGNPTKETTIVQRGAYAVRFNCTDTTTDSGLNWASGLLSHAPNLEYFTVEITFRVEAGTSLVGAGVILDWVGMTNNRATLSLSSEVPTPIIGKWYTVSKTLRRPANAAGTWTGMDGYLMANYTASYFGGAKAVKDIIFDWLNIRPSTAEEILAYTAPTTQYVDQAETDAINAAALTAQTKADAARDAAISDTTTRLLDKNKTVWSLSPATGTAGYIAGDTWFQRDGTGAVIAQWEFTTSWQPRTVSELVIGGLSAGKLISGFISSDRIDASSLTAKHVMVGDFTNLVTNGFGDLGAGVGWGSSFIYDTVDKPSGVTGVFKSTAGQGTTSATATQFNVDPSTEYITELWIKADLPDSRIYIEIRDQASAHGTTNVIMSTGASQGIYMLQNFVVPTVWTKYSIKTTTTATATKLRIGSIYFNHLNGTERGATISMAIAVRRRLGGSLLVDGAIDGKLITGPTIQTDAGATTGIKLTPTELAGYDGTNKNFSLTSAGALYLKGEIKSGSTIEGARITGTQGIETSVTPLTGVKVTNTGIKAYDAGNNLTFHLDSTTGLLEVPGLKANSIKGDVFQASTITADKLLISRGANLFTDPMIRDTEGWGNSVYFTETGGKNGGGTISLPMGSTQNGLYYAQAANLSTRRTLLVPGGSYRIAGWVKTSAAAPIGSVQLYLRYHNEGSAVGALASNIPTDIPYNRVATVANTWTFVAGTVTIPESTTYTTGVLGVFKQTSYTTGTTIWSDLSIQQASGGELIVDGAITTNHMVSNTIDAAVLSAGTITAPKIAAKTITTDKLVITSSDNLVVGGDMALSAASWQKSANMVANATAGRGTTPALRFTGVTSALTSLNLTNRVTVEPDNRFRCSIFVKSSAALAIDRVRLMLRCYTTATAYSDVIGVYNTAALVANTWTQIQGVSPALPANTIAVEFYLSVTNSGTAVTTDIDYVSATRASDGTLVVDGAITANKLETELVLASKIIAGDSQGTHAEMSPQGFRVYADAAEVGAPSTEVVRLGVANTNDYFAITKSDGSLAASISQDGVGSFDQVNATDAFYYKGQEISTLLGASGTLIAAAQRTTNSKNNAVSGGAFVPYLRLEAKLKPYRLYKIWTSAVRVNVDAGTGATLALGYQNGILADISNVAIFTQANTEAQAGGGARSLVLQELFAFSGTADATISFLLMFGVQEGTGQAAIVAAGQQPIRLVIEDWGPTKNSVTNGVWLDSATPPPVAINTYVKTYGSNNSMNYQGSNAQYAFDTGRMYQGLSPAGYGNLKSIGLFPDMTADLAGATINYIRVYFNFQHWYNNAGGTARIGVHGHTGIPSTYTSVGPVVVTSSGWPKPGARWVDIPSSYWDGFKTGSWRGVTLEGNSTYETYGYAERPTIEISYNK